MKKTELPERNIPKSRISLQIGEGISSNRLKSEGMKSKKYKNIEDRREQLRDAQKKLVEGRRDKGQRKIGCYLLAEFIEAVKAMAKAEGKSRSIIYAQAIMDYINQRGEAKPPSQVTVPASQKSEGGMTAARQRQRYEILESQDIKAKRAERNRTQRLVASLRNQLPSGHPLAKIDGRRGPNIADRAPRYVRVGEGDQAVSQPPGEVLAALDRQIRAWHQKEDEVRAALAALGL